MKITLSLLIRKVFQEQQNDQQSERQSKQQNDTAINKQNGRTIQIRMKEQNSGLNDRGNEQ